MSKDIFYRSFRWTLIALASLLSLHVEAQVTWRRSYGGFGSDRAFSVRQTTDGGYIISGSTGSFGNGSGDMYMVRVDGFGDPEWSHTYGGAGVEESVACREVADGFIIAGSTSLGTNGSYDMVLIRTDMGGGVLWEKHYGTSGWIFCRALDVLPDGFVLGGVSYGPDTPQGSAYIVRTDFNGDTLWTAAMGGEFASECHGITATSDLGIIAAGEVGTTSGSDDAFLMKLGPAGGAQWTATFGGDTTDYFSSVLETQGGNYVANGGTRSINPYFQIYLVGVTSTGQLMWERYIGSDVDAGGAEVRRDHGNSGYVLTGFNTLNGGNRDMILTVTDGDGYFQFGNNYGNGEPADGWSVDPTVDGGYVVAGWCEGYGPGQRAMYVVKTDASGSTGDLTVVPYVDPLRVQELAPVLATSVYPDPAIPGSVIHVPCAPGGCAQAVLCDAQGRVISSLSGVNGDGQFLVPFVPLGLYRLSVADRTGMTKNYSFIIE